MDINDLVSPSDHKLIELSANLIDDIGVVTDIFKDRNSQQVSTSFAIGLVATFIHSVCNIDPDDKALIKFLAEQAKED